MGYTTEFQGQISVTPPLNPEEVAFLTKFNESRRTGRANGPYSVEGEGDGNQPLKGQPGIWCQWVPTDDGKAIEWDGGEKFYASEAWMTYLIDHFLKPGAIAAAQLPFLQANHTLNGVIKAQGEEMNDRWKLVVTDNVVSRINLE